MRVSSDCIWFPVAPWSFKVHRDDRIWSPGGLWSFNVQRDDGQVLNKTTSFLKLSFYTPSACIDDPPDNESSTDDFTSLIIHGVFMYLPSIVLTFGYWVFTSREQEEEYDEEEAEEEEDDDMPRHLMISLTLIPSLVSSRQQHLSTRLTIHLRLSDQCLHFWNKRRNWFK
jgi:hypothetical protein